MDEFRVTALAPTRSRTQLASASKNAKWTPEESEYLSNLVGISVTPNWNELALVFPGKTPQQIAERWAKVLNPALVKGSWTRDEDETIIKYVQDHGTKDWTNLATLLPGRIGKQCRERWRNHLDPDVNREAWSEQEDAILISWHDKIGTKWVKIAEYLPGRSDNAIKNRWNSTLSKRIEYAKLGVVRPKRGRPSQKIVAPNSAPIAPKPKSADDLPKPPRFDQIPESAMKDAEPIFPLSASIQTPTLLSPFAGLRSPFSGFAPSLLKDNPLFGSWSPADVGQSQSEHPNPSRLFSPSGNSFWDGRCDFLSSGSPIPFPK
jgi:hypothetical protein